MTRLSYLRLIDSHSRAVYASIVSALDCIGDWYFRGLAIMNLTKDDLIAFMIEELAIDPKHIQEDTALFSGGVIDSFSLISIMTFLEQKAGISIEPSEVTLDNFDSIKNILSYVGHKS